MLFTRTRHYVKIIMSNIGCSFHGDMSYSKDKLIYPAASRNREPIFQALKRFLSPVDDEEQFFLEVSSGSGQHIAHFAPNFPKIKFQPSEFDPNVIHSINAYSETCPTQNILPAMEIDITKDLSVYGFKPESIDYIYNANMMHISPYECTLGLFKNAGKYLKHDALMITYGPYAKDGVITPQSNVDFDRSLKDRDSRWGLRDINDLMKLGEENNLALIDTIEMPSNNKTLIWKKN